MALFVEQLNCSPINYDGLLPKIKLAEGADNMANDNQDEQVEFEEDDSLSESFDTISDKTTISALVPMDKGPSVAIVRFAPNDKVKDFQQLKDKITEALDDWFTKYSHGKIVADNYRGPKADSKFDIVELAGHLFDLQLLECLSDHGIDDLEIEVVDLDDYEQLTFWKWEDNLAD